MQLYDGAPLWGLVNLKAKKPANVTTVAREHLWLPGHIALSTERTSVKEYLPSVDFPILALSLLGETGSSGWLSGSDLDNIDTVSVTFSLRDYTGWTNAAMFRKWQDLAIDADGVAK